MLADLQRHLADIYCLDRPYDVREVVITDPVMARALGEDALLRNTRETLLVSEDDAGLAVSLYLDGAMLERLESSNPVERLRAELLDDLWQVVEGISHFNCIVWKATRERSVSLLELELQGEIDKYVSTLLLALDQADAQLADNLHQWLFDDVRFHDDLDDEQLDRYRSANDYAARFCYRLRDALLGDDAQAMRELQQFYRLQLGDKISHIHTQAWARP